MHTENDIMSNPKLSSHRACGRRMATAIAIATRQRGKRSCDEGTLRRRRVKLKESTQRPAPDR